MKKYIFKKGLRNFSPAVAGAIITMSLLFTGCKAKTDPGEEAAAEIEAAMMEGRNAARIFINRPWKDTTDLQRNLLEARSARTKYDTIGKTECAAAYDSAFVSTIRTVNPDVAKHLE